MQPNCCSAQERWVRGDEPVAGGEQAGGLRRALGGGAEDCCGGVISLLGEGGLELSLERGRVDSPEPVAGSRGRGKSNRSQRKGDTYQESAKGSH